MNRRPDGTFAGILSAERRFLQQLKTKEDVEFSIRASFRGVPEEFILAIAAQVSSPLCLKQSGGCSSFYPYAGLE
jgi:hypothetical protein